MRKMFVSQLRSGMEVSKTIYAGGGQVLIKAGTVLTQTMISRLKRLGITAIYVEDGLLPDVEIEDVISEETRAHATALVKDILIMEGSGQKKGLRVEQKLKENLTKLLEQLMNNPTAMIKLSDIRAVDDYTFGHCVNVCVLSVLTGMEMNYSKEELFHLGLGAMLHDMGKINVPDNILNKPSALTDEEFAVIKRHTEDGFHLLSGLKEISSASANIALQHHERSNGDGYPRGIKGEEISRFARVVAVTDVFDALTSNRVYRAANLPHEALEMFLGSGGFYYDHGVIKAFYQRVAAFPTACFVQLGTGEIAAVIDTPKGQPLRPTVRVMFGLEGEFLSEPYEIALAEEHKVIVKRVVPEEEIQQLLNNGKKGFKMI